MAKIVIDGQEAEIPDNEYFNDIAEGMGVPFGCTEGICGSCRVEVQEGSENLTPLTQEEQDMGMTDSERLLCQCKVKQGIVKFTYW